MDAAAPRGESLGTATSGVVRQPWPLATTLLLGLFILLAVGQVFLTAGRVVTSGGIERHIRDIADFRAVLTGGLMIHEGAGALLYDEAAEHAYQARVLAPFFAYPDDVTLPNSHPPFESLLVAPLMGLPYAVPFALWTAIELLALALSLWLLARATGVPAPARWLLIAAACAYQPFHGVLLTGQSSPLVLLGFCAVYAALRAGREWWAGVGLAVVLLKPQHAVLITLLLLLHRHWKPLVAAAGIWLAASVAVMPIIGADWPLRYARYLAGSTSWGTERFEYPQGMYNWRGLIIHLLGGEITPPVAPLTYALSALSVGLVFLAWWRSRRVGQSGPTRIGDPLWALTAVVTLLVASHLYAHDLTLLIFPGWLIVTRVVAGGVSRAGVCGWLALVLGCFALPIATFFLAESFRELVVPNVIAMAVGLAALGRVALREARRG